MKRDILIAKSKTLNVQVTKRISIGPTQPVFVIAEAGSNWRVGTPKKDIQMAKKLIRVAADSGCDAVKFQVFRPESVYVENAGSSPYLSKRGTKKSVRTIFSDLAMPYEMLPILASEAKRQKILFLASAFSTVDLQKINGHVLLHKIASYEIRHIRLLEYAGSSGKPLVLSTGASTEKDIVSACRVFRKAGGKSLCLMQCTAAYPAPVGSLNLNAIPRLSKKFRVPVGLSDHSQDPILAPAAAVALGANLIEKHFTMDQTLPGPDHAFAVSPKELEAMVRAIRSVEASLGSGDKEILSEEEELKNFARRGLQAIRDIKKGERFLEGQNFDILRPGRQRLGMDPREINKINGRWSRRNIRSGEGIQENDGRSRGWAGR